MDEITGMKELDRLPEWGVIHCSATKPWQGVTEEMIREWHIKRGFTDIGYHVFIRQDGTVEYGRPFDVMGAHVKESEANTKSLGICLEGGLDDNNKSANNFSDAQWESLQRVIVALTYLFPGIKFAGHRDFGANKDCPCFSVAEWLESIDRADLIGWPV